MRGLLSGSIPPVPIFLRTNEAIDKVRREEQSHNVLLKKTRYLWLKNPESLTIKQNETLGSPKNLRLKTLKAYSIKLALRYFWNQDPHSAESYLKRRVFLGNT